MGLYSECAKGSDIMINDPILTRRVDQAIDRLVRLAKEGARNRCYVQIFP